jgi:hypothetical protein
MAVCTTLYCRSATERVGGTCAVQTRPARQEHSCGLPQQTEVTSLTARANGLLMDATQPAWPATRTTESGPCLISRTSSTPTYTPTTTSPATLRQQVLAASKATDQRQSHCRHDSGGLQEEASGLACCPCRLAACKYPPAAAPSRCLTPPMPPQLQCRANPSATAPVALMAIHKAGGA